MKWKAYESGRSTMSCSNVGSTAHLQPKTLNVHWKNNIRKDEIVDSLVHKKNNFCKILVKNTSCKILATILEHFSISCKNFARAVSLAKNAIFARILQEINYL